jgi:Protein of unknown function (DUF3320)
VDAIERARLDADSDEDLDVDPKGSQRECRFDDTDIVRSDQTESRDAFASRPWVVPYVEAKLTVPSETPIHETSLAVLAGIVAKVVEIEGPIHREEVARRITSIWGLQRTGGRIAETISKVIESATYSGVLNSSPDFVTHSRMEGVPVRCRSNVASTNLKKPEMIPQVEVRQAILYLVTESVGVHKVEIAPIIARLLGFKSTSPKLKDLIEGVLACMVGENDVCLRDEKLFPPS